MNKLALLQKSLGYRFRNKVLLREALTHSSYANLNNLVSNEQLEFLGDSVVNLIIVSILYSTCYPFFNVGELTRAKSVLVSTDFLAHQARKLRLQDYILINDGEDGEALRENSKILEDTFEALMGAVFLDGGWKNVYKVLFKLVVKDIERIVISKELYQIDAKTTLQILSQKEFNILPEYKVISEEGPEHSKLFTIQVSIAGEVLGKGVGRSKREASKEAAKAALSLLKDGVT